MAAHAFRAAYYAEIELLIMDEDNYRENTCEAKAKAITYVTLFIPPCGRHMATEPIEDTEDPTYHSFTCRGSCHSIVNP